jgi:diacylglycerol kinase
MDSNFEKRIDRGEQGRISEQQLTAMQETAKAAKDSARYAMWAAIVAAAALILVLVDHLWPK